MENDTLQLILDELKIVRGDIAEIRRDVAELRGDNTEMRGDIVVLKQGLSEANGKLDKLDCRVSSLETDMRETKHIAEGIDQTTRRLWWHVIEHDVAIGSLSERLD